MHAGYSQPSAPPSYQVTDPHQGYGKFGKTKLSGVLIKMLEILSGLVAGAVIAAQNVPFFILLSPAYIIFMAMLWFGASLGLQSYYTNRGRGLEEEGYGQFVIRLSYGLLFGFFLAPTFAIALAIIGTQGLAIVSLLTLSVPLIMLSYLSVQNLSGWAQSTAKNIAATLTPFVLISILVSILSIVTATPFLSVLMSAMSVVVFSSVLLNDLHEILSGNVRMSESAIAMSLFLNVANIFLDILNIAIYLKSEKKSASSGAFTRLGKVLLAVFSFIGLMVAGKFLYKECKSQPAAAENFNHHPNSCGSACGHNHGRGSDDNIHAPTFSAA